MVLHSSKIEKFKSVCDHHQRRLCHIATLCGGTNVVCVSCRSSANRQMDSRVGQISCAFNCHDCWCCCNCWMGGCRCGQQQRWGSHIKVAVGKTSPPSQKRLQQTFNHTRVATYFPVKMLAIAALLAVHVGLAGE